MGGMRTPQPLPADLARRSFTLEDGRRHGLSDRRLRARDLLTPSRKIRVPRGVQQALVQRIRPYAELYPDAVVSHTTLAELRGVPLPSTLEHGPLHLTFPPGSRGARRRGVATHRAALSPLEVETYSGLRCTTPDRLWLDLAAMAAMTLDALVAAGDYLVCHHRRPFHARTAIVTLDQLAATVASARARRGLSLARRALPLIRVGVDSVKETELRLMLVRAGLSIFEVGVCVVGTGGRQAWVDLGSEAFRVAIEYDGGHHLTPEQQRRDAERRQILASAGYRLVELNKEDLRLGAEHVVSRVVEALRAQGWGG